jgi:hypothetical protein
LDAHIQAQKSAAAVRLRLTCFAHLDDEYPPDYRYPPMWRKEWDRKHAERTADSLSIVKMDPVVELSQSLKAAGIHPSQLEPTIADEATIAPPNAATAVNTPQRQPSPIIRWLDRTLSKVFDLVPRRSWKDKRND